MRFEDSFERGIEVGPQLVERGFDGVVCVSDSFALGVLAGLQRSGLRPGRDLAVVGFDNTAAAAMVEPGLTSVHQPMEDVGEMLVMQLSNVLANKDVESSQILVAPRLVVRGSSATA